jgi:hypothetical protein
MPTLLSASAKPALPLPQQAPATDNVTATTSNHVAAHGDLLLSLLAR